MSDPVLHIKDSYYFEVPKFMLPARYKDKSEFPDVWVKNDDQFQKWEASRLHRGLEEMAAVKQIEIPGHHELEHQWEHWQHEAPNHGNFAKPLDVYLESLRARLQSDYSAKCAGLPKDKHPTWDAFLAEKKAEHVDGVW